MWRFSSFILVLAIGLSASPRVGGAAEASSPAVRFVRLDAAWAHANVSWDSDTDLGGPYSLDPLRSPRISLGTGTRQGSGFNARVEVSLTDRGTRFERLEMRRRYFEIGVPIGWRRSLGSWFVNGALSPRVAFRLNSPEWMSPDEELNHVVPGLDPELTLGRGAWHVVARYQWDLTLAGAYDSISGPYASHVELRDSGFSLGLGIEMPF